MSGYKNFAVAGAGYIGKPIVKALIEKKNEGTISSVTILTRSAGGHEDLVASGVKPVTVDYGSPSSLKSALDNIDVVISTLGVEALDLQGDIAVAAKTAGVKLFVPSEFGNITDGAKEGAFKQKDDVKTELKELGLPYAAFYTGVFPELLFKPGVAETFGYEFANGKATVGGSGDSAISFTVLADVARFVAHALTAFPPEKIERRVIRIEGDRTTFNQIPADWTSRTGKKLTVTHRPRSDFEEAVSKNPADFVAFLTVELDSGRGIVGRPDELANAEWPEWKPKKAIDTILEVQGQ
ncbi:hypothetical protein M0805_004603 [Coniferiporia weirii]|nr:hypothetical protein M0805_004603 [Coniferiporia weirii]